MTETENVTTYARIRPYNPAINEDTRLTAYADTKKNIIINKKGDTEDTYNFTQVFDMKNSTDDLFEEAMKPLLDDKILKGINSIFMVYGQSGSGKSYTLIGERGRLGLLPMSLEYLCSQQHHVEHILIRGIEAYGTNTKKIKFYDLAQQLTTKHNQKNPKKFNAFSSDYKENRELNFSILHAQTIEITKQNCLKVITDLQDVSHMAPTLKNPHSSRGHTVYFCCIQMKQMEDVYLIAADLAGSEGQTALGSKNEFVAGLKFAMKSGKLKLSKKQRNFDEWYKIRSREAGCINSGLTAVQTIFQELIKKKMSSAKGSGLRKLLSEFISLESAYSILFTLSASANNHKATKSTLKFAKQAQLVEVETKAAKPKIDTAKMIKELQQLIEQLKDEMDQKDKQILDLQSLSKLQTCLPLKDIEDIEEKSPLAYDKSYEYDSTCIVLHRLTSAISMAQEEDKKWNVHENEIIEKCDEALHELSQAQQEERKWTVNENDAIIQQAQEELKSSIDSVSTMISNMTDNDKLKSVFTKFDTDKSNSVDKTELQKALKSMNHYLTIEEIDVLFQAVGKDGDDELNFEDFKVMMKQSVVKKTFQQKMARHIKRFAANMSDVVYFNDEEDDRTVREFNELTGILREHFDFIEERTETVDNQFKQLSGFRKTMLMDAKDIVLKTEKKIFSEIMNVYKMGKFLKQIIEVENLFDFVYTEKHKKQQVNARKQVKNIQKYEDTKDKPKPKPISKVESFVDLMFAGRDVYHPKFDVWLRSIAKKCILSEEFKGAQKKEMERAFYKAFYVYGDTERGFERMTDVLRCSFVFNDWDNLYKSFIVIEESSKEFGGILRCKDRFNPPEVPFGYRDLLINVYCPGSKIVCEIQLQHDIFYRYKEKSHDLYKTARLFEDNGDNLAYNYAKKYIKTAMDEEKKQQNISISTMDDNTKPLALLKKWKLDEYAPILIDENGFDDIEDWKKLTEDKLQNSYGFKEGHAVKFVRKVSKMRDEYAL